MSRHLIPWRGRLPQSFGEFEREMENLVEQFFANGNKAAALQAFVPRTTVAETDDEYVVEADLPGLKPDDIHVEMRGNELWLSGTQAGEGREGEELPPHRAGIRMLRSAWFHWPPRLTRRRSRPSTRTAS